jgi:hypothetical protein
MCTFADRTEASRRLGEAWPALDAPLDLALVRKVSARRRLHGLDQSR